MPAPRNAIPLLPRWTNFRLCRVPWHTEDTLIIIIWYVGLYSGILSHLGAYIGMGHIWSPCFGSGLYSLICPDLI